MWNFSRYSKIYPSAPADNITGLHQGNTGVRQYCNVSLSDRCVCPCVLLVVTRWPECTWWPACTRTDVGPTAASELRDDWLSSSDVALEPMSGTVEPVSIRINTVNLISFFNFAPGQENVAVLLFLGWIKRFHVKLFYHDCAPSIILTAQESSQNVQARGLQWSGLILLQNFLFRGRTGPKKFTFECYTCLIQHHRWFLREWRNYRSYLVKMSTVIVHRHLVTFKVV